MPAIMKMRSKTMIKFTLWICGVSLLTCYAMTFVRRHPHDVCRGENCAMGFPPLPRVDIRQPLLPGDNDLIAPSDRLVKLSALIDYQYQSRYNGANKNNSISGMLEEIADKKAGAKPAVVAQSGKGGEAGIDTKRKNFLEDKGQSETASAQDKGRSDTTSVQNKDRGDTASVQDKGRGDTASVQDKGRGDTASAQDSDSARAYLEKVGIIKDGDGVAKQNTVVKNPIRWGKSKKGVSSGVAMAPVQKSRNVTDGGGVVGQQVRNETKLGKMIRGSETLVARSRGGHVVLENFELDSMQAKNLQHLNANSNSSSLRKNNTKVDINQPKITGKESDKSLNTDSKQQGSIPKRVGEDSKLDLKQLEAVGGDPEKSQNQQPKYISSFLHKAGVIDDAQAAEGMGQPKADSAPRKRTICVHFEEGTGRIMFQIASAYTMAKERRMTLTLPEHLPGFSDVFEFGFKSEDEVTDVISYDQSVCEKAKNISNYKLGLFDEAFLDRLPDDEDIKLHGYFQSYKYFWHLEEELRDAFAFKEDVIDKAMETINVLHYRKYGKSLQSSQQASDTITLVGVHVRRADLARDKQKSEEGYRVAPLDYIRHAMDAMRDRYTHSGNSNNKNKSSPASSIVRFYVVTDDQGWVEANLDIKNLQDTMLVTNLPWAPSLALLAHMDHVIATVGTFGWWGAWLAGGDVIYYRDFLEPGSKMDAAFLAQDYFPSEWEAMV